MSQPLKLPYLNTATVVGRLVADPHKLEAEGGREGSAFTIASNRQSGSGKKAITTYIDVVCWGDTAKACNTNLGKGSAVMVSGSLANHEKKREKGSPVKMLQLSASAVQFLNQAPEKSDAPTS